MCEIHSPKGKNARDLFILLLGCQVVATHRPPKLFNGFFLVVNQHGRNGMIKRDVSAARLHHPRNTFQHKRGSKRTRSTTEYLTNYGASAEERKHSEYMNRDQWQLPSCQCFRSLRSSHL